MKEMNSAAIDKIDDASKKIEEMIDSTIKEVYPIGTHFYLAKDKDNPNKEIFTVVALEDHLIATTADGSRHAFLYDAMFRNRGEFIKYEAPKPDPNDESLPRVFTKKAVRADEVMKELVDHYTAILGLDMDKIQEREMIFQLVKRFMNESYLPKFFKSAQCEIVSEKTKVELYDQSNVIVDRETNLKLVLIRKDFLAEKIKAANLIVVPPKRKLISDHDAKKIVDGLAKTEKKVSPATKRHLPPVDKLKKAPKNLNKK